MFLLIPTATDLHLAARQAAVLSPDFLFFLIIPLNAFIRLQLSGALPAKSA
jgi:hypothetical protein